MKTINEKKTIGDICLKIQDIVNEQIIPREICEEINHLLCDIIRINKLETKNIHNKTIDEIAEQLKAGGENK